MVANAGRIVHNAPAAIGKSKGSLAGKSVCVHQMLRQRRQVQNDTKVLSVVYLIEAKTDRPSKRRMAGSLFCSCSISIPNIHLGNEIAHSFLLGVGLLPLTEGPVVRFFFYFLHRHHHEAVEGRFIYGVADRDAFVPALLTPDFSSPPRQGCTKLDRALTQFGHSGAARRRRNRLKTPAAALRVRALFALDVRPNS